MSITKQIEALKKKGISPIEASFEDGKTALFQAPDRRQLKLIFSKAGKGGPIAMTEAFVTNCYVGGDITVEEIKDEKKTVYLSQLAASIDDLLGTKKLELKKH